MDLFSTLAAWGGAPLPDDRAIDGIDMSGFLSGQRAQSGREGFPVYVGEQLHAVKWRNWKLHFIWQKYMFDPPQPLSIPRLFNLLDDPRERHNVFLPGNTWVKVPVAKLLGAWHASLAQQPAIRAGTPDPFEPAQG